MKSPNITSPRRAARIRACLQAGSALPLLVAAWPALAEPIVQASDGDIAVAADSASGTPTAVELTSNNGSVTGNVTTVIGTAVAGQRAEIVGLETLTSGQIVGNFGSITGTGSGELLALRAESNAGRIDLTVGVVDVSGSATSGITAHSISGDITVTGDAVIARGTGLDSGNEFLEAVGAFSDNGSVDIRLGSAESYGKYGSAIGAIAGGSATIVADSATIHSDQTVGVYAQAAGNASANVGTITSTAVDGQGAAVISNGALASLTSNSITVGDFARGAFVRGASGASVNLGTVNGGSGLVVESSGGNVAVTAQAISAFASAINATAAGDVTVNGGTIASKKDNVSTVIATATGSGATSVHIDTASGAGIDRATVFALAQSGNVTVTGGSFAASGDAGVAILAKSGTGNVLVDVDHVATTGMQMVNNHTADGIYAESGSGQAVINLDSGTTEGFGTSVAAAVGGAGATVTVGEGSTAGKSSAGIHAGSTGGDAVIKAGTFTLRGDSQIAMQALADTGKAVVTVERIDGQGTLGFGVLAQGRGGAAIQSGTVTVQRTGLRANAQNGSAASVITSGNTVSTGGAAISATGGTTSVSTAANSLTSGATAGILATATGLVSVANGGTTALAGSLGSAIAANGGTGVSISSNVVTVTGVANDPGLRPGGSTRLEVGGIIAESASGPIAINAVTVDVDGHYRYGISARSPEAITINAGMVSLESADSVAVAARGGFGDVSVTTGTVTTTGASGAGVLGTSTSGNVIIDAGTTRIENAGFQGNFTGDAVVATSDTGAVTISSQDAFTAAFAGSAAYAASAGSVSVVSGVARTTGDSGVALYAASTGGNASLDSASLTLTGANGRAARVQAANGVATGRFGDVTAEGANMAGILVTGRTANVTIDGVVRTTGSAITASGQTVSVLVKGSVASSSGMGIVATSPGSQAGTQVIVERLGSVSGTSGVTLSTSPAGYAQFANFGAVRGIAGAAVVGSNSAEGDPASFFLFNDGILSGGNGTAVVTGGGTDVLELSEGSRITGLVDLGAGQDALALAHGSAYAAGTVGEVAATQNVERLSAYSGIWRASGQRSQYDVIQIAAGATLTVGQDVAGSASLAAPTIELAGRLNLDLAAAANPVDLTGVSISGEGTLHLVGEATVLGAPGIQPAGGTFVDNGTLLLTDVFFGDVTTAGDGTLQLGNNSATGDMLGDIDNNGRFVFSRTDDYTLLGDFSGNGAIDKFGNGKLTFGGVYSFDGVTTVHAGSIAFAGALADDTELQLTGGTFDLSQVEGGEQTVAELSGTGGTLALGSIALSIQQFGDTVYSGSITGMGELIKEGSGDLKLNGDGTAFTGTGQVDGGTLSVNGDFLNANFIVNPAGTLGGNGTVGDTQIQGGTLGAGNSIGHLTVAGDLSLSSTSTLEVEVDPAGHADLIDVTGHATLGGAKVNVLAASGQYRAFTDYTVLTAAGGISGTFGEVSSNMAFLDPYLTYTANAVNLRLVRNDISFASLGTTANQVAIASLIQGYGYGNVLFDQTLTLIDANVAGSFASLTGEVYPAYGAATIETAEMLRRQSLGKMVGDGAFAWATGLYNNIGGGTAPGGITLDGKGVAGGFGYGADGLSAAAGVGILQQDSSGSDFDDGKVTFAIGQVAYRSELGLSVSAGAQFGWVEGDTRRATALGTISQSATGRVEGDYLQVFGEVAYHASLGGFAVEPFAGISSVSNRLDAVAEVGPVTALSVGESERDVTFGEFGIRFTAEADQSIRPYASAAYRIAWGDRASLATVGFNDLAGTASIGAIPIARDGATFEAGMTMNRGRFDFEFGYRGMVSNSFDSHGLNAGLRVHF